MPLTWHEDEHINGDIYADHGCGRYRICFAKFYGHVTYVALWRRNRQRLSGEWENVGGPPTIEQAKAACERHAASLAQIP